MRSARVKLNVIIEYLWIRLWIVWISPTFCLLYLMQPDIPHIQITGHSKGNRQGKEDA